MDTVSKEKRSWMMSRIKGRGTKPELLVRSTLHRMGFRFRLHVKDLPGKPDIVLRKYRAVIFVHGCFWHQHSCKVGSRTPKSNHGYWLPKLERTKKRDLLHQKKLMENGWNVLILWECMLSDQGALVEMLRDFLDNCEVIKN